MSFRIQKEGCHIVYEENGHKLHICIDLRESVKEFGIKYMQNWEIPYEYEYITKEKKSEILKKVYYWFIKEGLNKAQLDFDFKNDADYKDVFKFLKEYAGMMYSSESSVEDHNANYYASIDNDIILYNIKQYNHFSDTDKRNFHKMLKEDEMIRESTVLEQIGANAFRSIENYKISRLLKDYAKRRVEECREKPNQNPFNFGLYALDMILTEDNQAEIKDILTEYVQVAKDKNLSFASFLSEDRPLNILLKPLL